MSTRMYLGPYAVARFRDEVMKIRLQSCTNENCSRHAVGRDGYVELRFCGTCGSKIGEVEAVRQKRPDLKFVVSRDGGLFLIEKSKDEIFVGCYHNDVSPRNFLIDDDGVFDLTSVDPEAERRWFSEANAIDIIALDGAYDDVRVRWGLIVFYDSDS